MQEVKLKPSWMASVGLIKMPRSHRRVQGMSRMAEHMLAGVEFIGPRPKTRLEELAEIASRHGMTFNANSPNQLLSSMKNLRERLAAMTPDYEPRSMDNDRDEDAGSPDREVEENPEVTQGREDESDGEDE
jgi:hypothetical protein